MNEEGSSSGTDVDVSIGIDPGPAIEGAATITRSVDEVIKAVSEMTTAVGQAANIFSSGFSAAMAASNQTSSELTSTMKSLDAQMTAFIAAMQDLSSGSDNVTVALGGVASATTQVAEAQTSAIQSLKQGGVDAAEGAQALAGATETIGTAATTMKTAVESSVTGAVAATAKVGAEVASVVDTVVSGTTQVVQEGLANASGVADAYVDPLIALKEEFATTFGSMREQVKELQDAEDEAAGRQLFIKAAKEEVRKATEEVIEANERYKKSLEGISGPISKVLGKLKELRGYIFGLFAGFSFAAIVQQVASFEKALSGVRKELQGTDNIEESLGRISDAAIRMGLTTTFSAQESAKAMEMLVDAGADASTAIAAVADAGDLATASHMSLTAATAAVTNIVKAFNLELDQSKSIVDALAIADLKTNASAQTLAQGLRIVGSDAKAAGFSFQDTTAALAALSEAGATGFKAIGQFRTALLALSNSTAKSREELSKIGLDYAQLAEDLSDPGKGLVSVIKQLKDAGVDSGRAIEIFGAQAGRAIGKLISESEKLSEVRIAMLDGAQGAKELADIMEDNLQDSFAKLANAAKGALLYLGTSTGGFAGVLKGIVTGMTGFIQGLVGINQYIVGSTEKLTKLNTAGQFLRENIDKIGKVLAVVASILLGRYLTALLTVLKEKMALVIATTTATEAERVHQAVLATGAARQTMAAVATSGHTAAMVAQTAAAKTLGGSFLLLASNIGFFSAAGKLAFGLVGGWPGIITLAVTGLYFLVNALKDANDELGTMKERLGDIDMDKFREATSKGKVEQYSETLDILRKQQDDLEDYNKRVAQLEQGIATRQAALAKLDQTNPAQKQMHDRVSALQESTTTALNNLMADRFKAQQIVQQTQILASAQAATIDRIGKGKSLTPRGDPTGRKPTPDPRDPVSDDLRRVVQPIVDAGDPVAAIERQYKDQKEAALRVQADMQDALKKGQSKADVEDFFGFSFDGVEKGLAKLKLNYQDQLRALDTVRVSTKEYASALGDLGGRISPVEAITRKYAEQELALAVAQSKGGASREQYLEDSKLLEEARRQDLATAYEMIAGVDGQVAAQTRLTEALKTGATLTAAQRDSVLKQAEAFNPLTRQIQRAAAQVQELRAEEKAFTTDTDPKLRESLKLSGATVENYKTRILLADRALEHLTKTSQMFGDVADLVAAKLPELDKQFTLENNIIQLEAQRESALKAGQSVEYLDLVIRRYRDDLENTNKSLRDARSATGEMVIGLLGEEEAVRSLYEQREKLNALMGDPVAREREKVSLEQVQRAYDKNTENILEAQATLSGFPSLAQNVTDAIRGIWESMGKGLNDALTDLIMSAFDGFDDFKKKLRDMFKGLLAQIVSLYVQNKIVVPVLVQIAGFLGVGGGTKVYATSEEAVQASWEGRSASGAGGMSGGESTGIGGITDKLFSGFGSLLDKVFNTGLIGALKTVLKGIFVKDKTATETVKQTTKKAEVAPPGFETPAVAAATTARMQGESTYKGTYAGVVEGIEASGLVEAMSTMGGKAGSGGEDESASLIDGILSLTDQLGDGSSVFGDDVFKSYGDELSKIFKGGGEGLLASVKSFGVTVLDKSKELVDLVQSPGTFKSGASGAIGALGSVAGAFGGETGEKVGDLVSTANAAYKLGGGLYSAVKDFGAFVGGFKGAFTGINYQSAFQVGGNAPAQFVSGGGQVANKASTAGNAANFGGAVATVGAGLAGGVVGNAIGGIYGTQQNTNIAVSVGTTLGTIIGSVFEMPAVGAFIGSIVGGIVSSAIGGAKKTTSEGIKLELNPEGEVDATAYRYEKKAQSLFRGYGDPKYKVSDGLGTVDEGLTSAVRTVFSSLEAFADSEDTAIALRELLNKMDVPGKEYSWQDIQNSPEVTARLEARTAGMRVRALAPYIAKYDEDGSGDLSRSEERKIPDKGDKYGFTPDTFKNYLKAKNTKAYYTEEDREMDAKALFAEFFQDVAIKAIEEAEPIIGAASDRFLKVLGNFAGDVGRFVDGFQAAVGLEGALKINVKDEAAKQAAEKQKNATELVMDQKAKVQALFDTNFVAKTIVKPTKAELALVKDEFLSVDNKVKKGLLPDYEFSADYREITKRQVEWEANDLNVKAAEAITNSKAWQIIPEKMAELATELLNLKGAAVALLLTYDDVAKSLKGLITNTRTAIEEGGMTPEQLYTKRRGEFDTTIGELNAATDPGEIQGLTEKAIAILGDAFGMLDKDQQDTLRSEYLQALDDLQPLVDDQILEGRTEVQNISVSIDAAITDKINTAAIQQRDAAAAFGASVTSFGQWVQQLQSTGNMFSYGERVDTQPVNGSNELALR